MQKVSIIIPTLNSAKTLDACLKSIRSNDYPPEKIELLVADGGSSDDSVKIAQKYDAIIIQDDKRGPTMARLNALKHATGDVIAFTDGDAIADPDWIKNGVRHINERPNTVVGGPLQVANQRGFALAMQAVFDLPELLGLWEKKEIVQKETPVTMLATANFIVPASAMQPLRSATWDGYGGDHMLSRHLREAGFDLISYPDVRVQHLKRTSPLAAIAELYKWGKGHPKNDHKSILGRIVDAILPISILYFVMSYAFFGYEGILWATLLACVPLALEAVYAGLYKRSLWVAVVSPVAFVCYLLAWSAGCMAVTLSKKHSPTT
jgi:glycosyltransferase involved in cell wall biosynthesis